MADPKTLAELFLEGCERHDRPDRFLFKEGKEWTPVSTASFREKVLICAGALEREGIGQGHRVALLTYNRLEWAVVDYACHLLGAVTVPIFDTLPAESVEYILRDCGAKLLFLENRRQFRKTESFLEKLPERPKTISFEPVEGVDSFESFCTGEAKERTPTVGPEDLATLIYTSGTTGTPKGVMLTHANLVYNVLAVGPLLNVTPEDTALSFLPVSHVFERMADYLFFFFGATVAYCDNVGRVMKAVQQVRPTVMAAVPRFFELFCQKVQSALSGEKGIRKWLLGRALKAGAAAATYRRQGNPLSFWTSWRNALAEKILFRRIHEQMGGRIRLFVSGGAALSPETSDMLWSLGFTVLEGYGLSETSPVITVSRPGRVQTGTVGEVLPGTEVRIAEDGEILCKGPGVMKGYFGLTDATAEVIRDGWFSTGDIGVLEEGYVRITDRKKDLFKTSGGKYVAPQPIEQKLKRSEWVMEAVVVGAGRKYAGVLIVPDFEGLKARFGETDFESLSGREEVRSLFQEVVEAANKGAASHELVKEFALLPEPFSVEGGELTPTLKVKRRVVCERYADQIEGMYAE